MHTIRLRGFWEASSDGIHTRYARKFGRPRTLDTDERVWLVCESVPGPAEVSVNGQPVGSLIQANSFVADITDTLRERNVVVFLVTSSEPLGELVLEIRRAMN